MNIVALDTSTLRLGIGIITRDGRSLSRRWTGEGHSRPLFGRIESSMAEVKLSGDDIDLLGVVSGPGSFTGLRIGMAAVLGWAVAAGLPVQTVDTFAAMRASVPDSIYPLVIVIHSRGDDFYMQYLESPESARDSEAFVGSIDSLADLPQSGFNVCGPGSQRLLELVRETGRHGFEPAGTDFLEPDMKAVCMTASKLFSEREGAADDYRIEPYYMTLSQAQINFKSSERRL